MTKEKALEASNLLYLIERCEDYIDALNNFHIEYECNDVVINQLISETIEKINEYKQTIEQKLKEL